MARSRLSEFFQKQGKQLNCEENEHGGPFNKKFNCACEISVNDKVFKSEAEAGNKKSAQKKCALDMVIQLYRAGLIPGNAGKRSKDLSVKRQKKDGRTGMSDAGMKLNSPLVIPKWGTGRTTPYDDRHIRAKLEQIEQTDAEKVAIDSVMQELGVVLKLLVEKISDNSDVKTEDGTKPVGQEGPIAMPFPVGSFAKGLMLKGEKNPQLVLQCKEKPTVKLLQRVSKELQEMLLNLITLEYNYNIHIV